MTLLKLDNVHRHYRTSGGLFGEKTGIVKAVDGVSFQLEKCKTLGLVGESGCGKSTLARCILSLEDPNSGQISLKNKPLGEWDKKELRRKVQMIFQDPYSSLNPRWKIKSIVREPLDIHKIGSLNERRDKVDETLRLVGLRPEFANRYPHEFSGGQRQRVAIARALVSDPELLVCDEPVSALDVSIQAQVLNLLDELQDSLGLTYLFISHDLSVVGHVSDQTAVMYLGKIMEFSSTKEIFSNPRHPYTRALLSAVPPPDPDLIVERVPLIGDIPSPANPPTGCPFHPRCPDRMDICSRQMPPSLTVGESTSVACHLYGDNN